MNPLHLSMICNTIAFFGILLWCSGTRSLFFGEIELRKGTFWVASRWFGLGMWFTWIEHQPDMLAQQPDKLVLGFLGAICLFVGSIWKRSATLELKQDKPSSE